MKNKPFGYRWAVLFLWRETRAYLRSFGKWQCALFGLYSNQDEAIRGEVQCRAFGMGQTHYRTRIVYDEQPEVDSVEHLRQEALKTL